MLYSQNPEPGTRNRKGSGAKIWQLGEVVAANRAVARVRLSPVSSCEQCLAGRGCGAGVFSRLFARRSVDLKTSNTIGAVPGQRVLVGVAGTALAMAAARLYGIPLLGFIAGVLVSAWWLRQGGTVHAWEDTLALAAGLAVAGVSFALVARRPLAGIEPELRPKC